MNHWSKKYILLHIVGYWINKIIYVWIIWIYLINIIKFELYLQNYYSFLKENYFPDLPQSETAETHVSTTKKACKHGPDRDDDEIMCEKICLITTDFWLP